MNTRPPTRHAIWPRSLAWILAITSMTIVVIKYASPISDTDIWWQMVFGQHMLATGNLIIDHSIFTWTPAIPHSTYNAWIAEIFLYLLYAKMGPIGLIVLRYLAFGGFFALAAYFAIQRGVAIHPLDLGAYCYWKYACLCGQIGKTRAV